MNSIKLFTAASILQLIIAVGHLVGHFTMPRPSNETEAELMEFMATYHKQIAGGSMTILNSYDGLNIMYALFFAFAGTVNLTLRKAGYSIIKRAMLINGLAMAIGFMIAAIYFFWIPIFYFAICFLLFLSSFLLNK